MRDEDEPWDAFFGFSPDDLFRDLEEVFEEVFGHLADEGERNVWGFSVRHWPGEDPKVVSFGDATEMGREVEGARPLVDTYETDEEVEVVVELPGVSKEDVELKVGGDSLFVLGESGFQSYEEVVELPADVVPESAEAEYNNGVIQVKLEKAGA